jgi:hypothetical protein
MRYALSEDVIDIIIRHFWSIVICK